MSVFAGEYESLSRIDLDARCSDLQQKIDDALDVAKRVTSTQVVVSLDTDENVCQLQKPIQVWMSDEDAANNTRRGNVVVL